MAYILIRQLHPLRRTLVELTFESSNEEGGDRENILVGCEYTTIRSNHQSDDGTGQGTVDGRCQPYCPLQCTSLP